jgi:flagellar hook assembly protein FlgD
VLSFAIDTAAPTSLVIYDLRGSVVLSREMGTVKKGDHEFTWNGRDNNGRQLPSGTYFYSIVSGGERQSRKMLLLK